MKQRLYNAITDIPGLRLGHATDLNALTGCTVILCEAGAVGGVDQRGGAPGTRQTDALYPMHLVERVHAVLLSGGSAFGLDAAGGVARYLEERGVGFDVRVARVPIVPAAILFDLAVGRPDIRPGPEMGYQACLNASAGSVEEGNVGAGTGATVGKILGLPHAMKSGLGTCSIELARGLRVAALAAVNAFGDIIDPSSGQIIAGARSFLQDGVRVGRNDVFADTLHMMKELTSAAPLGFARRQNTVIGVVATNARLTKEQVNKVAQMSHDGLARSVQPAHTMLDGDTIFALSLGNKSADVNLIGACAAQVFAEAILRAVRFAHSLPGLPALVDLE